MVDPRMKKVITYYFSEDKETMECGIYGFDDCVPVMVYDGDLVIDFSKIFLPSWDISL